MGIFPRPFALMLRDAFLTEHRKEPVLAARDGTIEPAPPVRNDERLPIDESQRALVEAQWALVERAFRRDMGAPATDQAAPAAELKAAPVAEPNATASVNPAHEPAEQSRTPEETMASRVDALPQPRTVWPWRREPSVAERKRIVRRKWLVGSAAVPADKPGVGVASLVAIAAAAAVLAFWLMDHRFDGRPPAVPMALDGSAGGRPSKR